LSKEGGPTIGAQPPDQGIIDVDLHLDDDNMTVNTATGEVAVRGTLSCSQPPGLTGQLSLNVLVTQPVGQVAAVHGYRTVIGSCPGIELPFVLIVTGTDGRFVAGLAYISASVSNCAFSPYPPPPPPPPPPPGTEVPTATPAEPPTATATAVGAIEQQLPGGCDTDDATEVVTLIPSLTTPAQRGIKPSE
jgi:hypothetical protein